MKRFDVTLVFTSGIYGTFNSRKQRQRRKLSSGLTNAVLWVRLRKPKS